MNEGGGEAVREHARRSRAICNAISGKSSAWAPSTVSKVVGVEQKYHHLARRCIRKESRRLGSPLFLDRVGFFRIIAVVTASWE